MAKIKQICEEKLSSVFDGMGYDLVDVEYVKEGSGMSLIFTIDKEGGVNIDDCETVSRKIDPLLDEINPTEGKPYTLVVSSPGLDRPLKNDKDLKRGLGKEVDLTLFAKQDGKKVFQGVLEAFDEKTVTLATEDKKQTFERQKVASIKLVIKF